MDNSRLEKQLLTFAQKNIDPHQPILLGLSGGPDSICLLYLLRELLPQLDLHLVHIDHGWREESAAECDELRLLAEKWNLPFHTKRLTSPDPQQMGNIEAICRDERLSFFSEIAKKIQAQGVLLGHHRDDQAETVFKRFLEGVYLPYLGGIREISQLEDRSLTLFRPFLSISKKEIIGWLQKRDIPYFIDRTNSDPHFLRNRMRQIIFPFIKQQFGKNFLQNIVLIAQDANLIRNYLDRKVAPYLSKPLIGPFGISFDCSKDRLQEQVELHALLRRMGEIYNFSFNHSQIALAVKFLLEGTANKWIEVTKGKRLYFDRYKVFIVEEKEKIGGTPEAFLPLSIGEFYFDGWRVTVAPGQGEVRNHWRDVWRGSVSTIIPEGEYKLAPLQPFYLQQPQKKRIDSLLCEMKVPHYLSKLCPVVINNEGVIENFLVGQRAKEQMCSLYIRLEKIYPG